MASKPITKDNYSHIAGGAGKLWLIPTDVTLSPEEVTSEDYREGARVLYGDDNDETKCVICRHDHVTGLLIRTYEFF